MGFSRGELRVSRAAVEHVTMKGWHKHTRLRDCPLCQHARETAIAGRKEGETRG